MIPSSPDSIEIASYIFETLKNNKSFIYEMKLIENKNMKNFCFLRRWYYSNMKNPVWRSDGWNSSNEEKFNRKIVQKRDIMKWKIEKSQDNRTIKQDK